MREFSIIVPAYNEEKKIGRVLRGIRESLHNTGQYEIIVVDDGSRDATAKIAKINGVKVVRHPLNIGYGAALKSGIKVAKYQNVVFFDGDDSFYPLDIYKLLRYADDFDMVIGARINKEGEPLSRTFLRWIYTKFVSYLVGRNFQDVNSGFRLVKKDFVVGLLNVLPQKFSITTTLSILLHNGGSSIAEVPIRVKRQGKKNNKFKPIQDGIRFPYLALKMTMYYNPLKVLSPTALLLMTIGFAKVVYDILYMGKITESSVLPSFSGVLLLVFALLGNLVVKSRTSARK